MVGCSQEYATGEMSPHCRSLHKEVVYQAIDSMLPSPLSMLCSTKTDVTPCLCNGVSYPVTPVKTDNRKTHERPLSNVTNRENP